MVATGTVGKGLWVSTVYSMRNGRLLCIHVVAVGRILGMVSPSRLATSFCNSHALSYHIMHLIKTLTNLHYSDFRVLCPPMNAISPSQSIPHSLRSRFQFATNLLRPRVSSSGGIGHQKRSRSTVFVLILFNKA